MLTTLSIFVPFYYLAESLPYPALSQGINRWMMAAAWLAILASIFSVILFSIARMATIPGTIDQVYEILLISWAGVLAVIILPRIIVVFSQSLRVNRIPARIFDLGFLLASPLLAGTAWLLRADLPIFLLILFGIGSYAWARAGVIALWYGVSLFPFERVLYRKNSPAADNSRELLTVFNLVFPDPEQQKAIRLALVQQDAPSKKRRLIRWILYVAPIGILGALMDKVSDGVIGFFVQRFLENIFPSK